MARPTGAIVWQGPSPIDGGPIVAIVTWHSENRKTGDMAQLWILRADVAPWDAVRTGQDASVCGSCKHRGDGTGKGRVCYVDLGKAPRSVFAAFTRGMYPVMSPEDAGAVLAGRAVRLGAYGDPAMLPVSVIRALVRDARSWTGYTHRWTVVGQEWAELLMASADTVTERRAARLAGWRSFYVAPLGASLAEVPGAVECAATRERAPRQCDACGMCAGTRNGAVRGSVDVAIVAHGAGARYVAA